MAEPELSFCWLTPGGATALDLLWLEEGLLPHAFHASLTAQRPRLLTLADKAGAEIDRAVACAVNYGVVLSCHGGAATRAELTHALLASGARQRPVGNLWNIADPLATASLADLCSVQGDLGVQLALRTVARGATPLRAALALPAPELRATIAAWAQGTFLYSPPRVQLWGPVNAGKSSLLNALCGQRLAAVGPEAGLTRDVIEGRCEAEGVVLRLFDAPGVPESNAALDHAAYALAEQWRRAADLTLELVPPGRAPSGNPDNMAVFSRSSEDPRRRSPSVDVSDPASLAVLKSRIVERFLGALLALPGALRVLLPRAVLAELAAGPRPAEVLAGHAHT